MWFWVRFVVCVQTLPDYVIKMSFIKWDGTQVDLSRAEDPTGFAICVASFGLVGVIVGERCTAIFAVVKHSGKTVVENCRKTVGELSSSIAHTNTIGAWWITSSNFWKYSMVGLVSCDMFLNVSRLFSASRGLLEMLKFSPNLRACVVLETTKHVQRRSDETLAKRQAGDNFSMHAAVEVFRMHGNQQLMLMR